MLLPNEIDKKYEEFVKKSNKITGNYQDMAGDLWDDYLGFEKIFFDKYDANQETYKTNLEGMPKINLQMPGSMGGSTIPLAPKVHSSMYTDQFNAMNTGIGNQANARLAGLGSRDALSKNMFQANLQNLQNSLMPIDARMDSYQLGRSGQFGIDAALAGKYQPSTMSTWAPVVGSVLQSDAVSSALGGLWDAGKGLLDKIGLF